MTTRLSKILTVFVTIASTAFMAVIIANWGGPNWRLKAQELKDVSFDRANPQAPWTVTRRTDSANLGGGPTLPAAIVSAQKKLIQEEQQAQQALDQQIAGRTRIIAEAKSQIEIDLAAMQRKQAELDQQFADLQTRLDKISQDATAESKRQLEDLAILKLRAEDFVRFKNQLEELRAQRQQATDEQARLQALLYQARSNLARVQKRQDLLKQDGADVEKYNGETF